jgi:hypothetical protein
MFEEDVHVVVSIASVEWIVDVFDTEMVSDDDATLVVVISVEVSVGPSDAGYVVVCWSVDVCWCVVVTSVDAVDVIDDTVDGSVDIWLEDSVSVSDVDVCAVDVEYCDVDNS